MEVHLGMWKLRTLAIAALLMALLLAACTPGVRPAPVPSGQPLNAAAPTAAPASNISPLTSEDPAWDRVVGAAKKEVLSTKTSTIVGAGMVFLLSDNRDYHDDSRDFGPVPAAVNVPA